MSDTTIADPPTAQPRAAPPILDEIKEDLGITDTLNDAWLIRRIDGIWSRMEVYTSRKLCVPPSKFVDDWGNITTTNRVYGQPPPLVYPPRASVFLRYIPVPTIEAVEIDGALLAPADMAVRWDKANGKVMALRTSDADAQDLGRDLRAGNVRITYTAGWDEIPSDLYEVVLGAITPLWNTKKNALAGASGGAGGITGITVADVGSIDLAENNAFVTSAAQGSTDPLLGPYAAMLNDYIDHRAGLGWEGMPTTEPAP